jgi:hypothetical protein
MDAAHRTDWGAIGSVVGSTVTAATLFVTIWKARAEDKSLQRRHVKEMLGLIDEAERRVKRDSGNVWRDASFEDCLAKDLLASHIFGRFIT